MSVEWLQDPAHQNTGLGITRYLLRVKVPETPGKVPTYYVRSRYPSISHLATPRLRAQYHPRIFTSRAFPPLTCSQPKVCLANPN